MLDYRLTAAAWWLSLFTLGFLAGVFARLPWAGLCANPLPFMSACAALVTLIGGIHSFAVMRASTHLLRLGDDLRRTSKRTQKDSGVSG